MTDDYAGYGEIMERLTEERDQLRATLEQIAAQQPRTLNTLRTHGVVFDGPLGNDPRNWQHVAFTIYTDLCEVDSLARSALDSGPESSLEVASVVPTNPENEPDRESGGVAGAGNEPGTEAACGDYGW